MNSSQSFQKTLYSLSTFVPRETNRTQSQNTTSITQTHRIAVFIRAYQTTSLNMSSSSLRLPRSSTGCKCSGAELTDNSVRGRRHSSLKQTTYQNGNLSWRPANGERCVNIHEQKGRLYSKVGGISFNDNNAFPPFDIVVALRLA